MMIDRCTLRPGDTPPDCLVPRINQADQDHFFLAFVGGSFVRFFSTRFFDFSSQRFRPKVTFDLSRWV